jgi:hypothetical protein
VEGGVPPLGVPPGVDREPVVDRLFLRPPAAFLRVHAPFGRKGEAGKLQGVHQPIITDKQISSYLIFFSSTNLCCSNMASKSKLDMLANYAFFSMLGDAPCPENSPRAAVSPWPAGAPKLDDGWHCAFSNGEGSEQRRQRSRLLYGAQEREATAWQV